MGDQKPHDPHKRLKAAGAVAVAAALVVAFSVFPHDEMDHPVRYGLAALGCCACGPFSPLLLPLPVTAALFASTLWLLYAGLIRFTRLGLMHWGLHLVILVAWNFVGLIRLAHAGQAYS